MGKRVGFTYNVKEDWVRREDDPADVNAEFDKPQTIEDVVKALEFGGHIVRKIGGVDKLLSQWDNLDVDIVFNICEGFHGRNRESQVPLLLEMKNIPYVGSDALSLGITLDKIIAKKIFVADGIPTPAYFEAGHVDDLQEMEHLRFPLIVKARHEGSSKGMSQEARVEDFESLQKRVCFINEVYHQSALIEEFIRGTEFTVPVIGNDPPEAMPVVQISIDGTVELGDKFYSFERITSPELKYVCPAQIPQGLTQQLQQLARRVFESVGCRDMGRVDFRVDEKGQPFVLEINPLPYLGHEDVFNFFPKVLGTTYEEIINRILDCALKRYGLYEPENVMLKS